MPLDHLVLGLQGVLDRLVRRVRLGAAPGPDRRRLLIVQIDGLSQAVLEEAIAKGRAPFLAWLVRQRGYRVGPGGRGRSPPTPGFPVGGGEAPHVEATQAAGRTGIVRDGGTYGCVFTGGAASNLLTFARLKRPSGAGLLRTISMVFV